MATSRKSANPRRNPPTVADPITPDDLIEQLRALRQRIPDYGTLTRGEKQAMLRAAHVDPNLIIAGISAVGAEEMVEVMIGWTAKELLDESDDVGRWSAVADELKVMSEGVAAANLRRKYRVGYAVLQAYALISRLVKEKRFAGLRSYLEVMKEVNRPAKKRTKANTPAPASETEQGEPEGSS